MADSFEVYMGMGGVWTRVALLGNAGGDNTVFKSASDSTRLGVTDTVFLLSPRLAKVASDTLQAGITDVGVMVSSGQTVKVGTDTIAPRLNESVFTAITINASDTVSVGITETTMIANGDEGDKIPYGTGPYGLGRYGIGLPSGSGTVPVVIDFDINDFELAGFNAG